MDDLFRELSPEEIKLATIQFMGQHLTGEMKELNKNIISESSTLKNLNIDPVKVLQTVSAKYQQPYATSVNAGINTQQQVQQVPVQQPQVVQQQVVQVDPNQLEFNFSNSGFANSFLEKIDAVNSKLDKIINILKKD